MQEAIEKALIDINGTPGDARSFDALDALLSDQAYRLAFWRVAAEEINYRRFFDVNDLAAIRMELPEVFEEAHRLCSSWSTAGAVTGLRIDHPDGLYLPRRIFREAAAALRRSAARETCLTTNARSTSWSKKSSAAKNSCPTIGRCTARPVTIS